MKKTFIVLFALLASSQAMRAQVGPEIKSWVRNTTNATGYGGIPSNVQTVQYSATQVYISATCIPGYSIGPWAANPNVPVNKNFVYKITRTPQKNTGALTTVGLGHTGIWSNGVSVFNSDDGQTYNNAGVWHRNAYFFEGSSFDNCLGHPAPGGEYHHHVNPTCLYNDKDSTHHAPIIGYSLDGFPIYGAYAYADTNGTGSIKRMTSSYQLRNISDRTTLPDGSTASSAGPAINSTYPLGAFIQDYIYVAGSGDLDIHNGRYCKTPDYPNGTYAYFVTIDQNQKPVFPFTMADTYYGVVQAGNTGPTGAHNTVSEPTTIYTDSATTGLINMSPAIKYELVPNPVEDYLYLYMDVVSVNNVKATITDAVGRVMEVKQFIQPSIGYAFDMTKYNNGIYFLTLEEGSQRVTEKIIKSH